MPRYDRNNGVRVLYPKTEILQVFLTPDIKERWLKLVDEDPRFSCSSEYIRFVLDLEIDKVKFYVKPKN